MSVCVKTLKTDEIVLVAVVTVAYRVLGGTGLCGL